MARSFNGGTDLITLPAVSGIFPAAPFTLVGWGFCTNTTSGKYNTIIGLFPAAGNTDLRALYFKGQGTATLQTAFYCGSLHSDPSNLTCPANAWNHLAFTYDGTTLIPYVNGVAANTLTGSVTTGFNSHNLLIGNDSVSDPFTGNIADCAEWNVVLTASEIAALANGARPGAVRANSLVGWWPLDGIQSPEPDLSGNANNGTLTGTGLAFGPPLAPFTPRWPQFLGAAAAIQNPFFPIVQDTPIGPNFPASLRSSISFYNPTPPLVVPGVLQAQILL